MCGPIRQVGHYISKKCALNMTRLCLLLINNTIETINYKFLIAHTSYWSPQGFFLYIFGQDRTEESKSKWYIVDYLIHYFFLYLSTFCFDQDKNRQKCVYNEKKSNHNEKSNHNNRLSRVYQNLTKKIW